MRPWEFESLWSFSWDSCFVLGQTMRLPHGLVFWIAIAADNVAAHSVASGWFGPPVLIVALVAWSCGPMDRASALRARTASSSPAKTTAPPYVAHGCLSGYGVSESLDSVTEVEPRQTQQVSYLLDGSAVGMHFVACAS